MKKFILLNATTVLLLTAVLLVGAMSTRTAFGILTPSYNVQQGCTGLTVVSDSWTLVIAGNVPSATYPYNATYAWEPSHDTDPSYWDNSLVGYNFSASGAGADWIWENHTVVNPVDGDIVNFTRTFEIPCCCCPGLPTNATLYITCDNAYEVYLNGIFVGSAQIEQAGWETSNLTEPWINGDGWQSVENYDVSNLILPGENILEVRAVNEYFGPLDNIYPGTKSTNPAGLIFELDIACDESDITLVSCNAGGIEQGIFSIAEDVYVNGSNFPPSDTVDIYVIPSGLEPTPGNAVTLPPATTTTGGDGTLPITLVWSAPLTVGEYDVWVDMDQNGIYECTDAYFKACTVYLFLVIPEYIIGSIGAVLATFGSFVLFRLSLARARRPRS